MGGAGQGQIGRIAVGIVVDVFEGATDSLCRASCFDHALFCEENRPEPTDSGRIFIVRGASGRGGMGVC